MTHSAKLGGHIAWISPRYRSGPPANTDSLALKFARDKRDIRARMIFKSRRVAYRRTFLKLQTPLDRPIKVKLFSFLFFMVSDSTDWSVSLSAQRFVLLNNVVYFRLVERGIPSGVLTRTSVLSSSSSSYTFFFRGWVHLNGCWLVLGELWRAWVGRWSRRHIPWPTVPHPSTEGLLLRGFDGLVKPWRRQLFVFFTRCSW